MQYIIGCDIGTTNVKALAFSSEGEIIASESASYPMEHPEPGHAEQDPEILLRATIQVLEDLISRVGHKPMGVSFSAVMHSLMALNRQGDAASRLLIWADNRSAELADALRNSQEGQKQYQRTGVPIHAMTPASKLLWINKYRPEGLFTAWKYAGIKDFVIFKMTGELLTDYSTAAATGLLNLGSLAWDAGTLDSLELSSGQLPQVVSPYFKVQVSDSPDWEMLAGVPIVVGGSDGCLANLGSGAVGGDTLVLTIGTSGAVRKTSRFAHLDARMRTFCYPLDRDCWIIGGPTNNGGVVYQWLKDTFFADSSFEEMEKGAAAISPGADGLLFFPYLLGERAPLWDSAARGCFHGLSIEHTRYHFARGVMEGILMNLYNIAEVLLEKEPAKLIYASGGFTRSREFVRMLADLFGVDVALNETGDAGCTGAALVGLRALGQIKDFEDIAGFVRVSEIVKYDETQHLAYKEIFSRFKVLLAEVY